MNNIKIPTWSEFFEMLISLKVPICDVVDYIDSITSDTNTMDPDEIKVLLQDLFKPNLDKTKPICHPSEIMRCCDGDGGFGDSDYSYVILNWGQQRKTLGSLIVVFHYDEINSVCSLFHDERFFFFGEVLVVSCQKELFRRFGRGRRISSSEDIDFSATDYIRFQNLITGKFGMAQPVIQISGVFVVDCEYEFTYDFTKPFIECSTVTDDSDGWSVSNKTKVIAWEDCNHIE